MIGSTMAPGIEDTLWISLRAKLFNTISKSLLPLCYTYLLMILGDCLATLLFQHLLHRINSTSKFTQELVILMTLNSFCINVSMFSTVHTKLLFYFFVCKLKWVPMMQCWNNFNVFMHITRHKNIEIETIHFNSIGVIKSKFAFK